MLVRGPGGPVRLSPTHEESDGSAPVDTGWDGGRGEPAESECAEFCQKLSRISELSLDKDFMQHL